MQTATEERLLKDYTDMEKGAYLGAIASIATADHAASDEEVAYIMTLADSADLSEEQKKAVARAAKELTGEELKKCLDILKNSELRFSLMTDLISFANTDNQYTPDEQEKIKSIGDYLGINEQQFSLLNEFVEKTNESQAQPEEIKQPGFLSALGLDQKFKKSGINMGSLTKGLLTVAGPMILASLMNRRRGSGIGGMNMGGGGGLGSLISMFNGGRGYGGGTGNLLSRILKF